MSDTAKRINKKFTYDQLYKSKLARIRKWTT